MGTSSEMRVEPRKAPRQGRSRVTVDAILTATARVLVEFGYDRASTNLIARVAGVSVGSLYQYFPSKEALVLAVARRHEESMVALLAENAAQLGCEPVERGVLTYIRAMLRAHALEPELHRVLHEQAMHLAPETLQALDRRAREIVKAYLHFHREAILPVDLELAAFVLVTIVEALTSKATAEDPRKLSSQAFEDEVGAVVLRYLCGDRVPGVPARGPG